MIENNLLKQNFLGKDGFRWWIGQVAPEEAQGEQLNQIGNVWGCRVKVRIYGYHPADVTELKDIDLPWAQVLLSAQGGSGKANRARSIRVSPGDIVMGFFLDGDDAQLPVILGIFANNGSYYGGDEEYSSPFKPFTGYTSKVKPNADFIAKNESGSSSHFSQVSARFLTKEIVEDLNESIEKGKTQLKQLINSEELKSNLDAAASELNEFLNSEELQEGITTAKNELKQVVESGALKTGMNEFKSSSKEILEKMKEELEFPEVQAFGGTGMKILFGGGTAQAFSKQMTTDLENMLPKIKDAVPKDKFKEISKLANNFSNQSKPIIANMVGSLSKDLAGGINEGLHKLHKNKFSDVFKKTGNLGFAKKAAANAQKGMIGPILDIQDALPCVVKNVGDKMLNPITDLIIQFTDNVENFTECIGDQFVGALFNEIIGGINNELGDVMKGVSSIFDGDLAGILRGKADGILGLASIFDECAPEGTDISGDVNEWTLGVGPTNISLENIAGKVLDIANAAQELSEASASPGGIIGNLGLFDFMRPDVSTPGFTSTLSDCYTGPPLNCSGIKVNMFGGGGQGAQVSPIIGALVSDTFAVQTASLIGMKVTNPGFGYKSEPFVEIYDTCRKGYGAVARSVIDYDPSSPTYQQLTDVYIVSSGENYPVIETDDDGQYTVDHVAVISPGQNYKPEDIITDQKGNVYDKFLDDKGRILNVIPPDPRTNNLEPFDTLPVLSISSATGFGAVIKAQLAPRPEYQGEVKQVIDCITPRNAGIVGFVNGEPYYGPFHVHPTTGAKMVGVAHTTSPHAIIYDTPQESRTSRSPVVTSTSYTTVSSPQVQTNVSNTTTTSQPDTSSIPQTDPVDTSSQQTSGQSYTPPPSSPPSGGGSSGSGGGSSGGGGYGGGY